MTEAALSGLDRDSPAPLHEQVASSLTAMAAGLPPGAALPTEAQLMRRFGVSRTTVRKGLTALDAAGLTIRRQGKGTFVARRGVSQTLSDLGSFVEGFGASGLSVQTELVDYRWVDDVSGLPPDTRVQAGGALGFRRLYRVDGTVWAYADCFLFEPFGSNTSRSELAERPSFEIVRAAALPAVIASNVHLSGAAAGAEASALLGVPRGSPVLKMTRLLTTAGNTAAQYSVHHLHHERFEFALHQRVPTAPPATGTAAAELRLRMVDR